MRFDDFHVLATSFELLCAALLLRLSEELSPSGQFAVSGMLGSLCGLCVLTRLNDGVLLLAAVFLCAVVLVKSALLRAGAPLTIVFCAIGIVAAVLKGIGESVHDWWFYSIYTAARIKGGSDHLLLYPLRLPIGTLREFALTWRFAALAVYAVAIEALAVWLSHLGHRLSRRVWRTSVALASLAAVPLWRNLIRGNAARVLVAFAVLALYATSIVTCVRLYRHFRGDAVNRWTSVEALIFTPLAQLVSISLSAARWYPNTNPPVAMFLVLLPVPVPWFLRCHETRALFFTWVALLTFSAGIDKLRNPFDWFNYRARSFDAQRVWFQHPDYGPMLIETSHRNLMCTCLRGRESHAEASGVALASVYVCQLFLRHSPVARICPDVL